jgi:copper chaperone CopZ
MTQNYQITGMTCNGCRAKVQNLLEGTTGVTGVKINLEKGEAIIEMKKTIPEAVFKSALQDYPKYQIVQTTHAIPGPTDRTPAGTDAIPTKIIPEDLESKSWLATYKPLLLIFLYITTISLVAAGRDTGSAPGFNPMAAMRVFMAGFFLTFSFFKLLDITSFADSYSMYDIIAKKFKAWGYLYVFIEALLGLSYALNFHPLITSLVTVVVMSVSIIGVLKSVLEKNKIKCACLGAVFNLPMSSVTIIEDALMLAMGVIMVFHQ